METISDRESDRELLKRFGEEGDEAAFGQLVNRHAAMVRGVALRCTGEAPLADDVTQSVFFLLAQRAASVPAEHLAGWLHRAAFLTARNSRRNSLRYQRALRELVRHPDVMTAQSDTGSQGSPWEEIRPYLDEAVARLPERARRPVILRFFESRSVREIAALTGSSEAAVRKALERSLHRLSGILRRRGIVTNGATLGAMLTAHSLLAPPASAAAVAAGAMAASSSVTAAVAPSILWHHPIKLLLSPEFLKIAGLAALLASLPVAWMWRQQHALKQELREVRQSQTIAFSPKPDSIMGVPNQALAPPGLAANPTDEEENESAAGAHSPTQIQEKSAREASRELARMNLYLPDLSDAQRDQVRAVFEAQSSRRAKAFEEARQSGAFARLADGMHQIREEDKALLRAANPAWDGFPEEADPLQDILTEDQYSLHREAVERRKVNDAEGVASDTVRALGQSFDLSSEQKDAIFQAVAAFELTPLDPGTAGDVGLLFGYGSREAGRDHLVRAHLSEDQASLFDQKLEEDRRRREQFLKKLGGVNSNPETGPGR